MLNNCMISGFADEIDSSLEVQIKVLGEIGQNYLELRGADGINVADFTIEKANEIKDKLDQAQIKVSAIGSPIGKIGIEDDFEPHFEKYQHIVKLAHLFKTKYIRMFSFYMPEGLDQSQYQPEVFKRLERMISYAEKEHVILLHENEKDIYGDSALRCQELMKEFYGEHFQCIFDFANFVQCKQATLQAYDLLKDYIVYIHVKDAIWETGEVTLPGEGDGQLSSIFTKLEQTGYTGFLSLEPHLFHFVGLEDLQKETQDKHESNGIRAYKQAYRSLNKILGNKQYMR